MTDAQFGGVITIVDIEIVMSQNHIFQNEINLYKCLFSLQRMKMKQKPGENL